ncbi:ATP-grasp domain-containing protein, partial [Streptomyces lunaelactis]|nr:ATP-grasp domain-containing protein [Streptomyces lunaelactis]
GWGGAVLKPANGTGSSLCFRVSSLATLHEAAARARAAAVVNPLMKDYIVGHGEFVLEQEAAGELLSVESLADRGEVHVLGLTGRYVLASDPVVEMGLQFPYHHPRSAEIIEKAKAIHRALGITHGPTQIEVMVPVTGPIELIDFNVRSAGT